MRGKTRTIGSVELNLEGPTELSMPDLHSWVLWQYPKLKGGWLIGAAHPPEPAFGWYPARIQPQKQRIQLFANVTDPFSSPEEAAQWMAGHTTRNS